MHFIFWRCHGLLGLNTRWLHQDISDKISFTDVHPNWPSKILASQTLYGASRQCRSHHGLLCPSEPAMPTAAHGYPTPTAHSSGLLPQRGDAAEVYSDTAKQWLSATVLVCDGNVITLAYKRNGESVEKTLPWPCPSHLRFREPTACTPAPAARIRPVCKDGVKCKVRQQQHLVTFAHTFDADYKHCCSYAGVVAEIASLRNLFTWVDADGSGKISLKELQEAVPLLEQLQGERLMLTKESWESLDEDCLMLAPSRVKVNDIIFI